VESLNKKPDNSVKVMIT